jgi:hypothetical protein
MFNRKIDSERASRFPGGKRKQNFFRPLHFQKLEDRYCLAFTMTHSEGVLTFEGTAGNDTLTDIYAALGGFGGLNTTLWYDTNGRVPSLWCAGLGCDL